MLRCLTEALSSVNGYLQEKKFLLHLTRATYCLQVQSSGGRIFMVLCIFWEKQKLSQHFMCYVNMTFRYWQNKAHSQTAVFVNNDTSHVNAVWLAGEFLKISYTYKFVHFTKIKPPFLHSNQISLLTSLLQMGIPMTCLIFKVYSLANKKLKIIAAGKNGVIWSHKILYLIDMLEGILIHQLRKGITLIPLLFWTLHLTHSNYISLLIYEFSC